MEILHQPLWPRFPSENQLGDCKDTAFTEGREQLRVRKNACRKDVASEKCTQNNRRRNPGTYIALHIFIKETLELTGHQFNINSLFQLPQETGKAKEPPPFNMPIMSGSAYFVVSRGYIRSVLEDGRVLALMEWAKDTYSPDEFLWATIQRMPGVPGSTRPHSKYDMSDLNAIARLVKWQLHEGSQDSPDAVYPECQGSHVRAICVYGAGDLKWMLKHHHLFANKFDIDTDPVAVYCLEKYLRKRALSELQ